MRYSALATAAIAALTFVQPVNAQEGTITLGAFLTVRAENVPEFEEAARDHARWHAEQGDPQPWPAYQALTGHGEYAFLAPDMTWSSMDNPALDMAADVAHWSETGASYTETEEFVIWTDLPGGNPPVDPTAFPIVQVFEFEIQPGGQAAAMDAIARVSEAFAELPGHWQWSATVSADGPPAVFIAVWADSFTSLGAPGPSPMQMISDHHGPEVTQLIMESFGNATVPISSQIWTLRPDLSHFPGE